MHQFVDDDLLFLRRLQSIELFRDHFNDIMWLYAQGIEPDPTHAMDSSLNATSLAPLTPVKVQSVHVYVTQGQCSNYRESHSLDVRSFLVGDQNRRSPVGSPALKVRNNFLKVAQMDFETKPVFSLFHLAVSLQQQGQMPYHTEFAFKL
jgi:hypothetical protein